MKKSTSVKILDVFAWVTFVFAIIIAFTVVLSSFSDKQNGREIFGRKMLIVETNSMAKPNDSYDGVFFYSGDLIIIKTVQNSTEIKNGDVITFTSFNPDSYGKTLTHKVKEVKYVNGKPVGYVTYGVKTGVIDQVVVKPENVIGVYQFKVPKVGSFFSFLKTPKGYYVSILFPCALLLIFFSVRMGRSYEKKKSSDPLQEQVRTLEERVLLLEKAIGNAQTDTAVTSATEPLVVESVKRNKVSFAQKLLSLEKQKREYFSNIHNEFLSYKKVRARISFRCLSYRFGKNLLAKITIRGKTLKLHLALKVTDFNNNVYFQKDLSSVKAYQDVGFTVKIKSNRGQNNAIKLINVLSENFMLVKKEKHLPVNVVKELKEHIKTKKQ